MVISFVPDNLGSLNKAFMKSLVANVVPYILISGNHARSLRDAAILRLQLRSLFGSLVVHEKGGKCQIAQSLPRQLVQKRRRRKVLVAR